MNFKGTEIVKFELLDTITWGVEKNIRNGYSIPVSVNDDEVKTQIDQLVKEHNTKNPLYGNGPIKTLYLKQNSYQKNIRKNY